MFIAGRLSFILLATPMVVGAQAQLEEVGFALLDATATSDCRLSYTTYDNAGNPIETQEVACPAGTVARTFSCTRAEAERLGAIFIASSAVEVATQEQIRQAKAQLGPDDAPAVAVPSSCTPAGLSASLPYNAYSPGVRVYSTDDDSRTTNCTIQLNSASASLSWNAGLWRREMSFDYGWGNWGPHHGCPQLHTGATRDDYGYHDTGVSSGPYIDESINQGGDYGRVWGGGDSYTGSVYL